MQVNNETAIPSAIPNGKQLGLRAGEQLHATVKERLPNNEALLHIKGCDVRVRFEGTPPSAGQIIIAVSDASKELPTVKEIKAPSHNAPQAKSTGAPTAHGLHIRQGIKGDLRKAVDILMAKGLPVSKSTLQELAIFFEKGEGTLEQKLETVSAIAKKGLQFTPAVIKAVHTAFHDSSLKDYINELIDSPGKMTSPVVIGNIIDGPAQENSIGPQQSTTLTTLEQLIKALKKEPDIQQIFAMLKEQLAVPGVLTSTQIVKVQAAVEKAIPIAESGRELASRQLLMSTLQQLNKEQSDTIQSQPAAETYRLTDEFISSLPVASKDYIVSLVSKKLSQLGIDFKNVKRDITRNLRNVQTLIDQNQSQAKSMLDATIKQLDQAILKSDIMLYTDMGTEKKLLQASSQLAMARKLLEKGDTGQARKIVHDVQTVVEKLIFKPSETRVQHFVSEKLFQLEEPAPKQQLTQTVGSSLQSAKDSPSGRQVFELLRMMGLTYEADQANSLLSKTNAEEASASLKEALLKLSQSNTDASQGQKGEASLSNITGQQLLSKNDNATLQSMMFVLPFLLKEKAEAVKVFVNSKSKKQKVDWENCSLYFLLETKRLGEVGILLSALDRKLSITIKNDKPDFQEKISPLAEKAKERLQEIGYSIGAIQFARLTDEEVKEEINKPGVQPAQPHFTERGYDFSV